MMEQLELAVLRALRSEFRGLAKPQIETRVGLEGHDVAGGSQLKNLLNRNLRSRKLIRSEGRTWHITDDGGNHLAHEQQEAREVSPSACDLVLCLAHLAFFQQEQQQGGQQKQQEGGPANKKQRTGGKDAITTASGKEVEQLQREVASQEQLGLLLRWQLRHTEEESKKFKEECMGRLQQDFELTHGHREQLNIQVMKLQGELQEARQAARRVFRYLARAGGFGINKEELIQRISTDLNFFGAGNGCLQGDDIDCRGGLGAVLHAALKEQQAIDGRGHRQINFPV